MVERQITFLDDTGGPMYDELLPHQQPVTQVTGKTFGIRAGAYIIDSVVYVAANYVINFVVGFIVGMVLYLIGREFTLDQESLRYISFVVGLVQFALYFAVFEWLFGATLGKLMLSMRVVKEAGEPCDFKAALIRALFRYIDGLFFGIPAYYSMKTPLFQRIGDKQARTIVVGVNDVVIQHRRTWWWFLVATALYLALNAAIALILVIAAIRY